MTLGATPYRGTGGFEAGHPTSEDRAEREALDGTTAFRQAAALGEVRQAGHEGRTWKEVADARGWHHGQATSALSILHKRGLIVRLEETRNRCGVYVVPEQAGDRPTVAQGRRFDSQTLARDVPLAVLLEAVRIATAPPPHEPTREDVAMVAAVVDSGDECDGRLVSYGGFGQVFEHPAGSQCAEHVEDSVGGVPLW